MSYQRPINKIESIFNNVFQNSLEKLQLRTENFHNTTKPVHTAPKIVGGFTDENGIYQYCLEDTGHTIPQEKYNSMWYPSRGKVKHYGFKGDNPNKTKIK